MSSEANASRSAKLPVFGTLSEAFAALRPIWGALFVQIAVLLFVDLLTTALMFLSAEFSGHYGTALTRMGAWHDLSTFFIKLIHFALSTNFALGISRWVLFSERPALTGLFRWGYRQWRLVGTLLLSALLLVAPLALVVLFMATLAFKPPLSTFIVFYSIAMLVSLWLFSRLLLVIPIVASDGPGGVIRNTWRLSRGNQSRLMGLALMFCLPSFAIAGGLELIFGRFSDSAAPSLAAAAATLVTSPISYGVGAVFIAALTVAFRWLTGRQNPRA